MSAGEHAFDRAYWDEHYDERQPARPHPTAANPYVVRETADLTPGTALDAGCGEGAEARWLADQGWDVTAVDIAAQALRRAGSQETGAAPGRVRWVQADLEEWEPEGRFDLVATSYAHPTMPQLDFYERLAGWVAPGGTLLVVGHGQGHGHGHRRGHESGEGDGPPPEAIVTAAAIRALFSAEEWDLVTAEETARVVVHEGGETTLRDVVVRATRRA